MAGSLQDLMEASEKNLREPAPYVHDKMLRGMGFALLAIAQAVQNVANMLEKTKSP